MNSLYPKNMPKIKTSSQLALFGEDLIHQQVTDQHFSIYGRNIRGKGFEMDLVYFKESSVLCIVEVKTRRSTQINMSEVERLLTPQKRKALKRGQQKLCSIFEPNIFSIVFELAVVVVEQNQVRTQYFPIEI